MFFYSTTQATFKMFVASKFNKKMKTVVTFTLMLKKCNFFYHKNNFYKKYTKCFYFKDDSFAVLQ